jgi:integrase
LGYCEPPDISPANRAVLLDLARVLIHALEQMPAPTRVQADHGQVGVLPKERAQTPHAMRGWSHALQVWKGEHRDLADQTKRETARLLLDLAEHAGAASPEEVTREHVAAFMRELAEHGRPHRLADGTITKRRKPAGAKSRRTYLSTLRAFFAWAVAFELVKTNPCDAIASPRVMKKQHRAFTLDEMRRIIAGASPEHAIYYRTLAITGIRAGALRRMPTFAFVLHDDQPRIEVPAEFSKSRVAYSAALDVITAGQLANLLRSRGPDHQPSEPLFDVPRPSRLVMRLKALCKRVGVAVVDTRGRPAGLHCFRRGTVTRLLDLGVDAKIAQLQAGHADVATTLANYCDRDLSDQLRAAQMLADAVGSSNPGDTGTPPEQSRRKKKSSHLREISLANRRSRAEDVGATSEDQPVNTCVKRTPIDGSVTNGLRRCTQSIAPEPSIGVRSTHAARQGVPVNQKWAILDSNQYPTRPGEDIPPRKAALLNRILDALDMPGRSATGADHVRDPDRFSR